MPTERVSEPTQCEMILEHLKKGHAVTPLEALKMFGCFRLGARIWELKQRGYDIEMQLSEVMGGKHVAEYRMKIDGVTSRLGDGETEKQQTGIAINESEKSNG